MDNFINPMLKSEDDERDFIFASSNLSTTDRDFPETLDLRPDLMPVRNQGSQGTCFAQSSACMKEWQERKNYGFDGYFSPQFMYNQRDNKYDHDQNNDEGMYGRNVMRLLKNIGMCEEKDYPYGKIEHKDKIPAKLFEKAKVNVIKSYARIHEIDDLKLSLKRNGPALICFPVFNYTGQMWIKREGDSYSGGHAMTVVGYNEDGFIIRNSWGQSWNGDGYTIYKYEDWGKHWEIWSTVDKKDIFPTPTPDPDPEPTPDPTPDPEPEPDPTPDPTPDPEPEPEQQQTIMDCLRFIFRRVFN